jgi:hypothetical protein
MITIKIQTDNSAFEDNYSKTVNHVLLQIQDEANKIEEKKIRLPISVILWDGNGNSIGLAKFDGR